MFSHFCDENLQVKDSFSKIMYKRFSGLCPEGFSVYFEVDEKLWENLSISVLPITKHEFQLSTFDSLNGKSILTLISILCSF